MGHFGCGVQIIPRKKRVMNVEEMLSFWAWFSKFSRTWFYADSKSITTDWIMIEEGT